jgi:hypothetical protein
MGAGSAESARRAAQPDVVVNGGRGGGLAGATSFPAVAEWVADAPPQVLAGCVITADALHTQREHAEFLVTGKRAHYILVVKKNQPGLYAQVKNLPWRQSPAWTPTRQPPRGVVHDR